MPMKSKANQIRTRLLILTNEEYKRRAKKSSFIINTKQTIDIELEDFKIEFNEVYSSVLDYDILTSPLTASTENNSTNTESENCSTIISQTKRKSIKLLHSICHLIKPISF